MVNGIRPAAHNRYAGLYIQDDFKATQKADHQPWPPLGYRNGDNGALRRDRSLSVYDQTHRLVANFTYELPFGRGKPLGASWNKAADATLGQWQVNGIAIIGSARRLQFGVFQNTSFSFGTTSR